MKRSILFFAAGMSLVLAGCVSTGGSRIANSRYNSEVDVDKIITVNQWAQAKGATVVWVNLPQKTRAESSGAVN